MTHYTSAVLSERKFAVVFIRLREKRWEFTNEYIGPAVQPLLRLPANWSKLQQGHGSEWRLAYLLTSPGSYIEPYYASLQAMSRVAASLVEIAGWNQLIDAANSAYLAASEADKEWMCLWLSGFGSCIECARKFAAANPLLGLSFDRFDSEVLFTYLLNASSYDDLARMWGANNREDVHSELLRYACHSNLKIAQKARSLLGKEFGLTRSDIICPLCAVTN